MSELQQVSVLYEALEKAEERLIVAQKEVDEAQKDYARLAIDLGDVLASLGLQEVTMANGRTVGLDTKYYGSAAQERMPQIMAFLKKHGNEAIAKPKKLKITEDDLGKLPQDMEDRVEYEIHHATLSSFLKELAKNGELTLEVMDLFKVYQENRVILK